MSNYLQERKQKLIEFAQKTGVHPDWHEPDEKNVSAKVVGVHLNNAFGELVSNEFLKQEFVVVLSNGDEHFSINLATLLAIATQ